MALISVEFDSFEKEKYELMFEYSSFTVFVKLNSQCENHETVPGIGIVEPDSNWACTFDYNGDTEPKLKDIINILITRDENSILDYIRGIAKLEDLYSKLETK